MSVCKRRKREGMSILPGRLEGFARDLMEQAQRRVLEIVSNEGHNYVSFRPRNRDIDKPFAIAAFQEARRSIHGVKYHERPLAALGSVNSADGNLRVPSPEKVPDERPLGPERSQNQDILRIDV